MWNRSLSVVRRTFSTKPADSSCPQSAPLNGIRVLDLTRIVAGPYCTMILADLGADVIKIERPGTGDESRRWGPPFLPNSRDSVYFMACNRNKRSVCVDLKAGREIIYDLARESDVLVENYVPGKLADMQLGYEHLRKVNPKLIYCSVSGYGATGPYAQRPGYDVIAASMGGLLNITGAADGPPAKVGVAVTDLATGLYAHGAIMAALLQRHRTQKGQKIDVNLLSTQLACLINVGSNYLNGGEEAKRWGTAHHSIVPYEAFKTKSGYLTLGTGSDAQFKALCGYLGIEEIAADAKYRTNLDRVENREQLCGLLNEILATRTNEEWMEIFADAPFPVGPINNMAEVFDDPHVKAIELVKELPHPTAGTVKVVGPPVVYSEIENEAKTAPPLLGQHTDEVLQSVLGYSAERINELKGRGIVQ